MDNAEIETALASAFGAFADSYQRWALLGGLVGVEPDPGRFIGRDALTDEQISEYLESCHQVVFATRAIQQDHARAAAFN